MSKEQIRKTKEERQKPQRTVQLRDQYAIGLTVDILMKPLANMSKHLKDSKPFENDNAVERNQTLQNQKIMRMMHWTFLVKRINWKPALKRLQQRLIKKMYDAKADEDNTVNVKLESPSHDSQGLKMVRNRHPSLQYAHLTVNLRTKENCLHTKQSCYFSRRLRPTRKKLFET